MADQPLGREAAVEHPDFRRQPDRVQMRPHPRAFRRAIAKPGREAEGEAEADRHRLAMQQLAAVADLGLQRMGEGMAEVEQGAAVIGLLLALVIARPPPP